MKRLLKNSIYKKIYKWVRYAYYNAYWWPYIKQCKKNNSNGNIVFYETYGKIEKHQLIKLNWGDDLNKYFMEYITNKTFIFAPFNELRKKNAPVHYSLIGSIIGYFDLSNTIIYGSGIIDENINIKGKPLKILSVRGPKTREVLLKHGIECPPNYGDPALLLPQFYTPLVNKRGNGCVIPNMGTDLSDSESVVYKLVNEYGLKLVDMTHYENWTDVIDEIVNSDFVISESLHGLVVAETYGIPNVWVEFKEHPGYWSFKYLDYFESIGKLHEHSIRLVDSFDYSGLLLSCKNWRRGKIDYSSMLKNFPFEYNK